MNTAGDEKVHMPTKVCNSIRTEPLRNPIRWLWQITLCVWLVSQLAIVESSWAAEMALSLIGIEIDGRTANIVTDVVIIPPSQSRAEKQTLRIGAAIEQGAEIVVPRRTVLVLESANGNQIRLQPGSRFKIHVVGSEGETYTVLLGLALFKVGRALNFFNVTYQSFLAIVKGTEFEMAVEPEKAIRFRLTEGRLVVQREVKVKILEGDKVAQLTASEILLQGQKTQVSYRLGVDEYLKEFKTFKDAEDYFSRQLQDDEKSGDYERIQEGLNGLASIQITVGKSREAIGYLERALNAAREHHDEAGEALLLNNLGVAWHDLGEHKKEIEYYTKALKIARKVYGEQHPSVAIDYNNLGSAWHVLGEHKKAIEYYEKALTIRLKLYPDGVHPDITTSYRNLSKAWREAGDAARSEEYAKKASEIEAKLKR